MRGYMRNYYRAYSGGYSEFRLWLIWHGGLFKQGFSSGYPYRPEKSYENMRAWILRWCMEAGKETTMQHKAWNFDVRR